MNANKYSNLSLIDKIRFKGRDEQERQFLFPGLYGNKAVTRNENGAWKCVERRFSKKTNKKFIFHPTVK